MLSSWSSAGSQRPPKAVRKRLAGVEGSTSSTSWLRTRNSAWYGSRGPGRAGLAPQAAPSPAQILPKPSHPSSSLPPSDSVLLPSHPNHHRPPTPFLNPRSFRGCPALQVFPSTHPLPGEIPQDWRWGGVGGVGQGRRYLLGPQSRALVSAEWCQSCPGCRSRPAGEGERPERWVRGEKWSSWGLWGKDRLLPS